MLREMRLSNRREGYSKTFPINGEIDFRKMGLHIFCFAWKQNCDFLPFSFPDSLFKLTFFLAKILSACYMVTTIKLYKTLWSLFMNRVMEFTNLKTVEVLQGKCLLSIIKSPKVLDNYLFILGRTKSESS